VSVLLVDWLGRGGIAQTTEAWVAELRSQGAEVAVATRAGRELADQPGDVVASPDRGGAVLSHARLARRAARAIEERRPATVVVQNYVLAPLERPVYRAARSVHARVVVVVHDHRLHSPLAGTRAGLRGALRDADAVVAHTRFVADAVRSYSDRGEVVVVPHPVAVGMLDRPRPPEPPLRAGGTGERLAVHFGVLKRGYKGTATVAALARGGVPGWRLAALGSGAPTDVPGLVAVPGYVPTGTLVAAVEQADVALLPYTLASQSGAVVLAQVLGTVPVASAVGGIPEQVADGVTGRLIPPGAPIEVWRAVLEELSDDGRRASIAAAAEASVWEGHRRFATAVADLVR
jgi:glycosyltransferase involved in cell wall biosynthesis